MWKFSTNVSRAPAWGKAGARQGGDVNGVATTEMGVQDVEEDTEVGPRRSSRARKPGSLVNGPEWYKTTDRS
jgi:hypothetical protein